MPTPEALAFAERYGDTVRCEVTLAELLDRFAAQRGAEAPPGIEVCVEDFGRIVAEHEAQTGSGDAVEQAIPALYRGLIALRLEVDASIVEALVVLARNALRAPHREGAEAMREDCIAEVRAWVTNTGGRDTDLLKGLLSVLPIPGKTDAGSSK